MDHELKMMRHCAQASVEQIAGLDQISSDQLQALCEKYKPLESMSPRSIRNELQTEKPYRFETWSENSAQVMARMALTAPTSVRDIFRQEVELFRDFCTRKLQTVSENDAEKPSTSKDDSIISPPPPPSIVGAAYTTEWWIELTVYGLIFVVMFLIIWFMARRVISS